MASSSPVETIFFARSRRKRRRSGRTIWTRPVELTPALRLKVERLLESHPQAMDFLAEPAVDRGQFDSDAATHDMTSLAPASGHEETGPRDRRARAELNETLDQERGDDVESALSFLQPSEKPGSLGRLAHYEVLEVLGNGGFGTVVKAFDEKLQRFVAIKLMSSALGRDLGASQAVRARSAVGRGRPPRECDRHLCRRGRTHPLSGHGLHRRDEPCSRSSRRRVRWSYPTCSGSDGKSPPVWPRRTRWA